VDDWEVRFADACEIGGSHAGDSVLFWDRAGWRSGVAYWNRIPGSTPFESYVTGAHFKMLFPIHHPFVRRYSDRKRL
jgi:hypothetical protein